MHLEAFEDLTGRDWDDDPDGTVALAVVGVGGFARRVALPAIAASEYCEVTTLVTGSPEAAARVAAEHDVAHVVSYEAYDRGEAAADYDAVYLATPNALHTCHAETAASMGKHVISEKPLAATVASAQELVDVCTEAGVKLMTAYRMQIHPVFRRLRSFLAAGGIGEVVHLHGDFTFPVLSGSRDATQWRLDRELAGGGALVDVGVYPLNASRFLLDRDPTAVSATACGDGPFEAVDERIAFQLSFGDRLTGSFTAAFSGYANTQFSILGADGRVHVESAFEPAVRRRLTVEAGETGVTIECPPVNEVTEEFDYFANAVLTDGPIEPDGRDGLTDVRVMDATYRASERGERVNIAL